MNDKIIYFYSALLVCNGILVGINIDVSHNTVYFVFSIVTVISTVIAALIAFPVFKVWKLQFYYSGKSRVFKELEAVAFNCIEAIEKYMGVHDKFYDDKKDPLSDEYKAACDNLLVTICNKKEKFRIDTDFAQSLLTNNELANFSYSYGDFEADIYNILRDINNAYQMEGESRCQKLCQVESDIRGLKLDIQESFRCYFDV